MTWRLSSLSYFLVADTALYPVSHSPFGFLVSGRRVDSQQYRASLVTARDVPLGLGFALAVLGKSYILVLAYPIFWEMINVRTCLRFQCTCRCWILFRFSLLLLLGIVYSCVSFMAACSRRQMEIRRKFLQEMFIGCLLWTEHRGGQCSVGKEVGRLSSF